MRDINKEGKEVAQSSKSRDFFRKKGSLETICEYEKKISQKLEGILQDSPNVTSVSFSPVKSTGFGTSDETLEEDPCIVFFVEVKFDKKRIPMGSKKIPKEINGVKTDVREGIAELSMDNAPGRVSVKLGTKISKNGRNGTLGPLFCSQEGKIGFITSLHVLLPERHESFIRETDEMYVRFTVHELVREGDTQRRIGDVTEMYYRKGRAGDTPGYEFALVELFQNISVEEGIIFRISFLYPSAD